MNNFGKQNFAGLRALAVFAIAAFAPNLAQATTLQVNFSMTNNVGTVAGTVSGFFDVDSSCLAGCTNESISYLEIDSAPAATYSSLSTSLPLAVIPSWSVYNHTVSMDSSANVVGIDIDAANGSVFFAINDELNNSFGTDVSYVSSLDTGNTGVTYEVVTGTPEPATWFLVAAGLGVMAQARKRCRLAK